MKTFQPKILQAWTHPDHYSGETYFDYYRTGIGQSRDSVCLERANFIAMLEKLGGESKTVLRVRAGHWAVGWVESILIHKSDVKSLKLADEIMSDFEDYPVIDDSTLSDIETEEIQSTIECYQDEFRKTVCEFLNVDFKDLSKAEKREVDVLISEVMHEDRGYRGVEDAFVTEESLIRGIEQSKYYNFDSNLIKYFQGAFNVEVA